MADGSKVVSMQDAVARLVRDGDVVVIEGFTHLISFAAGHEIIRQQRKHLHLIRMTPDLIYDQMIGMGCASELTFSWGGNPGVGSLHRLRDAVEKDWPQPLKIHEHSHAEMAVAYTAGASGLPCGLMRRHADTDLAKVPDARVKAIECPFTGDSMTAVQAINPDVTILHAQKVDAAGNVLIRGIVGAAKEAAMAARMLIVTVEEQVEELGADMNAIVLPGFLVTAVAVVPGGAYPSYTQGYYSRDNSFYMAWDDIARDRQRFRGWMERHVLALPDQAALLRELQVSA
jgi:glutaconate CoA-transferase subunit A